MSSKLRLSLHNTLTKQVEPITALHANQLGIYTCGPTVYLDPHIGNWRTFIFYDTLVRVALEAGFEVTHVLNITDVGHLVSDDDEGEDKLAKTATAQRTTAWEVAAHYTESFIKGMEQLNIRTPQYLPKATDHIKEQIALIEQLEQKGFTYRIDDGIYFDTSLLDDYGKLAGLDNVELLEGARVEANPQKRYKTDFALWKFSPQEGQRDMEWESPWGKGFPGWHIECSAMAMKYLGPTMDIHAGGVDHIPIHHTNEIAQSEAATGQPFASTWLHSEFMLVDGAKMAKSAGNGYTLADISEWGVDPLAFRLLMLQAHYRTQSNFTKDALHGATQRLRDLRTFADLQWQLTDNPEVLTPPIEEMQAALFHDLGTPKAFAVLSNYLNQVNENPLTHCDASTHREFLAFLDRVFGLDLSSRTDISATHKTQIREREAARTQQDWARADEIRDALANEGIELKDVGDTTLWSRSS